MFRFRLGRILREDQGFTLIELLAVAVILVILSLLAMPVYAEVTDKSRMAVSGSDLRVIEQALERHKAEKGYYPDRLWALVDAGYLKPNFTFESPWSSKEDVIYYFYTTDRPDRAQAYLLADSGPASFRCAAGDMNTEDLYQSPSQPFPCGRNPKSEARHWASTKGNLGLLQLHPAITVDHLKDFRLPCSASGKKTVALSVQCFYKADS